MTTNSVDSREYGKRLQNLVQYNVFFTTVILGTAFIYMLYTGDSRSMYICIPLLALIAWNLRFSKFLDKPLNTRNIDEEQRNYITINVSLTNILLFLIGVFGGFIVGSNFNPYVGYLVAALVFAIASVNLKLYLKGIPT